MAGSLAGSIFLGIALLAGSSSGRADTLILKDGRIFDPIELDRGADGVTVHFEHGDIVVPWKDVEDCIVSGDDGYEPKNEKERKKLADGYVRYHGKWVRPSQREKAIAKLVREQEDAVQEMKSNRLWRNRKTEETKNFLFEYTVPQNVFESYRDLMETYYSVFVKDWKIKRPKSVGKLHVKFYVDYDAFLQVTGMPSGVLGFFRFVEPYELAIYYDRLDPRGTEEVIYHEVGHYLQKLLRLDFDVPHWPGEALSEYYSGSVWNPEKKKLETGHVMEGRLSSIQLEIKSDEWVSLDEILLRAPERDFTDYSWGWSLVHFLMSRPRYAASFQKFFKALAKDGKIKRRGEQFGPTRLQTVSGEEVKKAFMRYMKLKKDEDLLALQAQWYHYIQDELAVTSTRGLEDAARRASRNGRRFRAKRLYEEAVATGEASALAHHRLALILEGLKKPEAAREEWAEAVRLDPLVAEFYIQWGESLLVSKKEVDKAEGKRLLELANELEPDNFYLERNLKRLLAK